jgi:CRP-like cAMP-binding protein
MKKQFTTTDLDQIQLFECLSQLQKEKLLRSGIISSYKKDERVYNNQAEIQSVFIVMDGSIKLGMNAVNGRVLIKNLVYKGELFGENIFTSRAHRTEYAEVLRDAQVLRIPKKTFKELAASNCIFAQNITKIIIERLQNLEERLQSFVFKNAKTRIVDFIKKTASLKGIKIGIDEILINHGMSHKEIAFLTDTSRQTVARVLGELKKDNLIHFSPRKPSKILLRPLLLAG